MSKSFINPLLYKVIAPTHNTSLQNGMTQNCFRSHETFFVSPEENAFPHMSCSLYNFDDDKLWWYAAKAFVCEGRKDVCVCMKEEVKVLSHEMRSKVPHTKAVSKEENPFFSFQYLEFYVLRFFCCLWKQKHSKMLLPYLRFFLYG